MSGYHVPDAVRDDLVAFTKQHRDFLNGDLDADAFKTYRVPFGIYEQREADTYMVRVKLAGGMISPQALRAMGELALQYGDKRIHVTTRAGAQLHHVSREHFITIIEALHKVSLTGRGGGGNTVRNIIADYDAGVAKDELFDVTPYAVALTERMLIEKDSYTLPRKYKITFSGSSADKSGASISDVGFIAKIKDGKRGFRVLVAGGMGAKSRLSDPFIDFLPEEDVFVLTQAIKEVFNENGNRRNKHRARLRFLIEDLGFEPFKTLVQEKMQAAIKKGVLPLDIIPIPEVTPIENEDFWALSGELKLWWARYVTPQKQQGYYQVKIPLSMGDIPADLAIKLADKLASLTPHQDVIRFSADQNCYLRNLTNDHVLSLFPLIKDIAPLSEKASLIGDILFCTGAATCQLGVTIPRGALKPIERALTEANLDLDNLKGMAIHLSGCPNSCGKHPIADIGFFGKLLRKNGVPYPAYNILVGAKRGEDQTRFARKVSDVSAFHLPKFIVDVLRAWQEVKSSYPSFADWVDDVGEQKVIAIAETYSEVPDFEEDKNPYFDYSATELFSLKGRGAGECSAGVNDLIEADKKALSELLNAEFNSETLKQIRFLAARMLLVTQGEDARQEEAVLKAFRASFIDKGYVSQDYIPLLEGEAKPEVVNLARDVMALYNAMDHTLTLEPAKNAPVETPAVPIAFVSKAQENTSQTPAKTETKPDRFKDYRGVACPMNFVKTKMDLSQMKSGEILEIVLDDGAPINNVPRSVSNEGHTILSETKEGEVWHVKIQKK